MILQVSKSCTFLYLRIYRIRHDPGKIHDLLPCFREQRSHFVVNSRFFDRTSALCKHHSLSKPSKFCRDRLSCRTFPKIYLHWIRINKLLHDSFLLHIFCSRILLWIFRSCPCCRMQISRRTEHARFTIL